MEHASRELQEAMDGWDLTNGIPKVHYWRVLVSRAKLSSYRHSSAYGDTDQPNNIRTKLQLTSATILLLKAICTRMGRVSFNLGIRDEWNAA